MRVVGILLAFLTITRPLAAQDNALSQLEAHQGWILLFDGQSLYGWTPVGGARWRIADGAIGVGSGQSGYLRTNTPFADFDLKCDFLPQRDSEAGILLRIDKVGDPLATGYKLQINDNDAKFPTGSLAGQIKAGSTRVAPGQWHTFEVKTRGDHFIVILDGNEVANGYGHGSKAGYISLQFTTGTPVAFKNIKLLPLGLGNVFNGQTLYQWEEVGAQKSPKKGLLNKLIPLSGRAHPSQWSVESGAIHVAKGPSELGSSSTYGDFLLQLDVRADARSRRDHPSGGIFVRADKTTARTGYDVQIHNEYQGAQTTQPSVAGTGGLAIQPVQRARQVASSDNQFFKLTVVACGHHIATWVNGYQTTDFEDTRADGPDALIEARTAPGPIRLEADNSSSSFDFRNIEVAALPRAEASAIAGQPANSAPARSQAAESAVSPTAAPAGVAMSGGPPAQAGNPNEGEISKLTQRALATNDAAQRVKIYDQILALDPNNVVAYNGRKDAQAQLDQGEAQQKQAEQQMAAREEAAKQQQERADANERTKQQAIRQAEDALFARNLTAASQYIDLAKKIAPNDPEVLKLEQLIQSKGQTQRYEHQLWYGLAAVSLASVTALILLGRRKRQPYLEVVDGMDKGKRHSLDRDVIHIGAVPRDGGNTNEIVVTDLDRSISRFHCEIHRQNGRYWVVDCNSANGTYLNGHRVRPDKPVVLKRGARLQLAEACTLRLGFEKAKPANS